MMEQTALKTLKLQIQRDSAEKAQAFYVDFCRLLEFMLKHLGEQYHFMWNTASLSEMAEYICSDVSLSEELFHTHIPLPCTGTAPSSPEQPSSSGSIFHPHISYSHTQWKIRFQSETGGLSRSPTAAGEYILSAKPSFSDRPTKSV